MIQSSQIRSSRLSLTTNSTSRNKFMRKPTSNNRQRSKSKDDPQKLTYSAHFIKDVSRISDNSIKYPKQLPLRKLRNDIASQTSTKFCMRQRQRKRQPTPVKSKRQLAKNEPKTSNNDFEWEIRVAELQSKMMEERKLREKYEKNYIKNGKQIMVLKEAGEKLQQENGFLKKEKIQLSLKIGQLQKTILESENNLTNTKNNLEKLRQTIKESRLIQLQNENRKMKKQKQVAENHNTLLSKENEELKKNVKQAIDENRQLKRKLELEKNTKVESAKEQYYQREVKRLRQTIQMRKEEKEKFLEERIKNLQEQNHKNYKQIIFLSIKTRIIEHKSETELLELKRKKEGQLKGLRVRYSKMVQEMKEKKEVRKRDDAFLFELSPEK